MTGAELGRQFVYPQSYVGADCPHEGMGGGLTLRQHYVGLVLQGWAANPSSADMLAEEIACWSDQCADAALDRLASSQS